MRIYGGHDYYDVGLSMGIDPTIVLLRGKSWSVPVENAGGTLLDIKPTTRSSIVRRISRLESISEKLSAVGVVFCGTIYRGVLITSNDSVVEGIWSADKLRAWAVKSKAKIEMDGPWELRKKLKPEDYFMPYVASAKLREFMILNKLSILIEKDDDRDRSFAVNPVGLKKLGFAKALDPYSAFQELSMWIDGVLGGTSPETVKITDDKTLLESHGFDNRISFRGPRIA